ncbi:hypothetical protein HK104_002540, partial [Borealophlyctis nickersoniae]
MKSSGTGSVSGRPSMDSSRGSVNGKRSTETVNGRRSTETVNGRRSMESPINDRPSMDAYPVNGRPSMERHKVIRQQSIVPPTAPVPPMPPRASSRRIVKPAARHVTNVPSHPPVKLATRATRPVDSEDLISDYYTTLADARDVYGFSRTSAGVSEEERVAFEAQYDAIRARRRAKWDSMLVNHGGKFPPRSETVKRFIRKGVPRELRSRCWFHYSGAEARWRGEPHTYELLASREAQDMRSGYRKQSNPILEHIEVLDR